MTICTASASPNARAIPSTTAVNNAGKAAGKSTRQIVCHLVAPKAYDPSRRLLGNASIASVAMVVIVGNIITDKTTVPVSKLNPVEASSNVFLIKGTKTAKPINPYTTEGIPTSNSITGCKILFPQLGAISTMKIAVPIPRGAATKADNKVTARDPKINGHTPYWGAALLVGSQSFPVKNLIGLIPSTIKDCKPFIVKNAVMAIVAVISMNAHAVTSTLPLNSFIELFLLDFKSLSLAVVPTFMKLAS